jgi:hypothetical protein
VRALLSDWRSALPLAGLGAVAAAGLYYFLRPKQVDPDALERERRSYLNRVGRIVEGQVVDVLDEAGFSAHNSQHSSSIQLPDSEEAVAVPAGPAPESHGAKSADAASIAAKPAGSKSNGAKPANPLTQRPGSVAVNAGGIPKLLYYSYSISGVTYETAQDITGLEERVHLSRIASGQTASVKYDPSNPSNSILLADDWSGLH